MEKKYCLHCHSICDQESICRECGKQEFQKIIFKVQHQDSSTKKE